MDPTYQLALAIGVPTLAVLMGVLINNSRLNDLRASMDQGFTRVDYRFDEQRLIWTAELRRVEEVIGARLSHLEERER